MIVVGLQEMVGLGFFKSVGNFFKSKADNEKKRTDKWLKLLPEAMNIACEENYIFDQQDQYAFYQGKTMQGCFIGLFTKRKFMSKIKDAYVCKVKAGMGGFAKNKGSVALRFKVNDSSMAFLNCHLQSGEG